jgi:AAHS family 4-hydroxybenzoate transporter-like MFS transporter
VLLLVPIQIGGDHLLLLACLGLNGLLANAVQTSMYALAAHVYPTGVRSTGIAWSATIGRVGGLIASLFGAVLIQAGRGPYWYASAIAMTLAFMALAGVRSHYPAQGRVDSKKELHGSRHGFVR